MAFKTVPVGDIYPLAGVFGKVALSRKGPLTVGWEITYPVAYTVEEDEYDEIIENFSSAIRVLPEWAVVHKQDVYLYDYYKAPEGYDRSYLEKAYNRHFEGRRYLTARSYLFVTAAPRYLIEKSGKASGVFGFKGNIEVPSQKEFQRFLGKCEEFISILCTSGRVKARYLEEKDWLGDGADNVGIIQRYMMMGTDSNVLSNIELSPSAIACNHKTAQVFNIGESDCLPNEVDSVLQVQALSSLSNKVFLSFGARLGTMLDCEHVVNQYIIIPNQQELLNRIDKEKRKMLSGIKSPDNRINAGEIQEFLDDAYKYGLYTVKANMNVIAWDDDDSDEETDVVSKISTALHAMGVEATWDNYDAPVVWYAGIPGNGFDISKENLMTAELKSFLALAPFEAFESSLEGGTLRICDRTRNVPLTIDTLKLARDNGWISNYNAFTLGGSGTGKSFFTNFYLRNLHDAGANVFIIDVGDSYEGLCSIIHEESGGRDGQYLSWDKDHPFSFNPFIGWDGWLNGKDGLHTDDNGVNFFLSFLQTVWAQKGGWTSDTKTVLMQFVIDFLKKMTKEKEKAAELVFDDFFNYVETELIPRITYEADEQNADGSPRTKTEIKADYRKHGYWCGSIRVDSKTFDISKFILSCRQYAVGGSYSFLLNDPHPKDLFTSKFTVFEVDKLSQDDSKFYSICILCIMNAFERKMRGTPEFKVMVIEEAWKAIANESMAGYLQSLWKTARKFNTSAMVVTQEIEDILSSPTIKTAILDNSSIKCLLDQSNHLNTFDKLMSILALSPKAKNLILSMNRANSTKYRYKEVFIDLEGKRSGVYATEVSPQEAVAYESAKDKKAPFLELAAQIGVRKAIDRLTGSEE